MPLESNQDKIFKTGTRTSWQNDLSSFFPSGLVAGLPNVPVAGSKYLKKMFIFTHPV